MEHQHAAGTQENAEQPQQDAAQAASSVEASRRRFARLPINTTVEVYEARDAKQIGEPFEGIAVDIGRGGMCLRSRRPLLGGQLIFIRMPMPGGKWKLLFGEVRHNRYADSGMYHMGVQFTPIPTQQEYQEWIEMLTRKFGGGDM
jgi:c-di-GMP-binding flagellar brake protein YcgR